MTGPFRDPDRIRIERVAQLTEAIASAERELVSLRGEVTDLSEVQTRALVPHKAPVAAGPHVAGILVGMIFGLPVVYVIGVSVLWTMIFSR